MSKKERREELWERLAPLSVEQGMIENITVGKVTDGIGKEILSDFIEEVEQEAEERGREQGRKEQRDLHCALYGTAVISNKEFEEEWKLKKNKLN